MLKVLILILLLTIETLFLGFTSTRLWAEYLFSSSQWRESLDVNPYDWRHRYEMAWALLQHGENREAAYHLQIVIREVPYNFDAASNLGVAYWRIGDREKATKTWEWVLSMWPRHREARENLGLIRP